MFQTRQECLDTAIEKTRGLGAAKNEQGRCMYAMDDHPGCFIGCQPGFPYALKRLQVHVLDLSCRPAFMEWLGETDSTDLSFLYALQKLHDRTEWDDGYIPQETVNRFAKYWSLVAPDSTNPAPKPG